jgi:hypothetical protein
MTKLEGIDVEVWCDILLGSEWHPAIATAEISDVGPFGVVRVDVFNPVEDQIFDWIHYFLQISPFPPHPQHPKIDLRVELPEGLGFDLLLDWGIYDDEPPPWWNESQLPGDLIQDALFNEDPQQLMEGLVGLTSAPFVIRRAHPTAHRGGAAPSELGERSIPDQNPKESQ